MLEQLQDLIYKTALDHLKARALAVSLAGASREPSWCFSSLLGREYTSFIDYYC